MATVAPICVDASFLLGVALGGPDAGRAAAYWRRWMRESRRFVAPALLGYEVTNVLRRYVVMGELTHDEAEDTLAALLEFEIELIADAEVHPAALRLARELRLKSAYDAHYLVVAKAFGGLLWTADARLHSAVAERCRFVRLQG
jgi:predicted nucleic acid-binding protein